MDYWKKEALRNEKRLRRALDKPTPKTIEDISTEFFDPWSDLMDGCVGAYNSEIDRLAVDVLKAIRDRETFDLLGGERALAAELFMYLLSNWLCDYGSSPRGLFPSYGLREMWDELIAKWEAYADVAWDGNWRGPEGIGAAD